MWVAPSHAEAVPDIFCVGSDRYRRLSALLRLVSTPDVNSLSAEYFFFSYWIFLFLFLCSFLWLWNCILISLLISSSLTFSEDVVTETVSKERADDDDAEEEGVVRCSKLYAPKSLVLVSRLDCFEVFRVSLSLLEKETKLEHFAKLRPSIFLISVLFFFSSALRSDC